ncbi:MAG: alpha/beta hydrolase, partial [Verrucomicrobia bacterium]|nr:alpha/beta hydrolase [Verrucomicrobiota bacterium]NDF01718.1 alpha/beta hydrolase [Verrucomicrobiota bacterium]
MKPLAFAVMLATVTALLAQPKDAFPLWAKDTPGTLGSDPAKDIPTLTPFFP